MKKLLFTAIGLMAACTGFAQKLDTGLLWKISGNGLAKPSYIFGTMHITCDASLDKNTVKALEETSQLYLELDMDDPNLQTEMMQGMAMKDGTKMSTLAKPEDYAKVNTLLTENLGMGADMVNAFKPALLSSMLIPKLLDCEMQSYEMELVKYSQIDEEPVYGLETVKEQMAIFDQVPYEEQMNALVKSAYDNMAGDKAEMEKLMWLYKNGDLNEMLYFIEHDAAPMMANHMDVFLNNRNANWIPRIEKAAKEKPTFFGVGAAHLPGDKGVIALLRKKGYKVEVVK